MTSAEAKKHLKALDYIPGKSKTKDMEPDVRQKTKDALHHLVGTGEMKAFIDEVTKAKPAPAAG